jgi:hypothetical protein
MSFVPKSLRLYRHKPFRTNCLLDVRTGRPESFRTIDPQRASRLSQVRLETLERPEVADRLGMVSCGQSKPARDGRIKTSHFEAGTGLGNDFRMMDPGKMSASVLPKSGIVP